MEYEPEELGRKWLDELSKAHADVVSKFEEIAAGCNVGKLINCLALHFMFASVHADLASEAGLGAGFRLELAAYYSRNQWGESTEDPSVTQVGLAGELLDDIASKYLLLANKERVEEPDREYAKLIRPLDFAIMQARSVRSSAYPEQWEDTLKGVFGPFGDWLDSDVGIRVDRFCEIVWAMIRRSEVIVNDTTNTAADLAETMQRGYLNAKKQHSVAEREKLALFQKFRNADDAYAYMLFKNLYEVVGTQLCSGRDDLVEHMEVPPTKLEWDAITDLLALTQQRMSAANDAVELRTYPLLVTGDAKLLPTDIGHVFEMFYLRLEARAETSNIKDRFIEHRGAWLEDRTIACLRKLFPEEAIYRNLEYPDPTQKGANEAELDIAVYAKPFLLLVECKSNRFHLPTNRGDANKVKDALQRIVDGSYTQARRALRYLEETDEAVLNEKGTPRQLRVSLEEVQQTFLISVSLQTLASFTSQLSRLTFFNLSKMDRYPLAISLPVLELVAEASRLPAVFLHYLLRRQAIHQLGTELYADELDFFGCYLQTRLQPQRLWDSGEKTPDFMILPGFTDGFDRYMYGKRGDLPEVDLPSIELGDGILALITHLHERRTKEGLSIAFGLLDLNDGPIADLERGLAQIPKHLPEVRNANGFSAFSDDTITVVTVGNRLPAEQLEQLMMKRALTEKFRTKATRAIGFGIEVASNKPFEHALYVDRAWSESDYHNERMLAGTPRKAISRPDVKRPGRNDLCPCRSGKKYKKCCMGRVHY